MGNEATKLEIQISGDQPFQPGDRIEGEVVMTTTKPLKDISGIEVRFEGGSWNAEPGERIEREVYVDKSISLPVDEGQLKLPGMPHRFAFSFDVPEGCKSSTVFSRFGWTKYSITASLQRNGVDLCSASRNLTILGPPTEPANEAKSNVAAGENVNNHDIAPTADEDDDDDNNGIATIPRGHPLSNGVKSALVSAKCSLRLHPKIPPGVGHNKRAEMNLQLPKRIFKPGEFIPISGTFLLSSSCAGPFATDRRRSASESAARFRPRRQAKQSMASDGKRSRFRKKRNTRILSKAIKRSPGKTRNSSGCRRPTTIPTESSLFRRFRNRRRLIIAMEQCSSRGKPKRLQVELPIQIGD